MKTTLNAGRGVLRRVAGIREVKARLSELLHDVQRGHDWTITERGRPIARIVPVELASVALSERIARLERSGVIDKMVSQKPVPPPLRIKKNLARELLDESRDA